MANQNKRNTAIQNRMNEAEKIQQRIFEREVDEELRQERLANLWKKYRFLVYGCVVAVIVGTIGCEWYQAWRTKVKVAESDRYESASVLAVQGQKEEALAIWNQLADEGKTGYRYLARMQAAGLLLNEGKREDGLAQLKALSSDKSVPEPIRLAALLAYVGHQIDTGDVTQLQADLTPILADSKNGFYGAAVELSALLHLRAGQPKQAEALLNTALKSQDLTPQVRNNLEALKDGI